MLIFLLIHIHITYLRAGGLLGGVNNQVDNTVGVSHLVIVPGDQFNKVGVQRDSGLGIEGHGVRVSNEVGGDDLILSVTNKALKHNISNRTNEARGEKKKKVYLVFVGLSGSLHGCLDVIVGSGLLQSDSEVDDGDINSGDTDGHTGQLAVIKALISAN